MSKRASRSHTKSGPGRYSGIGRMIIDPTDGKHIGVTQPKQRFAPAAFGGNWKGTEYLSYREADRLQNLQRWPSFMKRYEAMATIKAERR